MPVRDRESNKIKSAATPKGYSFENDTVYTSYEGLSASKVLGSLKPSNILLRTAAEVPEAAIVALLFYYFVAVLPKVNGHTASLAFAGLICFYVLDVIFGGIVGFAKTLPLRKKGSAGVIRMINTSISSFSAFTYVFAALALFFLKTSDYLLFSIMGIITILVYLTTIRFGLAPLLSVARSERTKSQALELSTQYFGGSFITMFGLNLLSVLVPAIALAFMMVSGSLLSLAILFLSIIIFGMFWQLELDGSFTQFEKIKRVSYKIN